MESLAYCLIGTINGVIHTVINSGIPSTKANSFCSNNALTIVRPSVFILFTFSQFLILKMKLFFILCTE